MRILSLWLLGLLVLGSPLQAQDGSPAEKWISEAWALLPTYGSTQRFLLTQDEERNSRAAAHILSAALELSPEHLRGLWSLGYTQRLLAENARNRGRQQQAERHLRAALDALNRATELDPKDPWSPYTRGLCLTDAGQHEAALADLELALRHVDAQMQAGLNVTDIRFQVLEWRCEVAMRAGHWSAAREDLRAFHSEFSSNSWPLQIALGESYLRERNFAAARKVYLTTIDQYPNDFQAFALAGYLAGLTGDRDAADMHMHMAIQTERIVGLYTRLWYWMLAQPEDEAAALVDLTRLLANPPSSLSAWDRSLGQFCIGQLNMTEFQAALKRERARRLQLAEDLDHLDCEAAFYRGMRLEYEAKLLGPGAAAVGLRDQALSAYSEALQARPIAWKWEWAFARLGLARLSKAKVAAPEDFEGSWHRPGAKRPTHKTPEAWLPGDLLLEPVFRVLQ